MLAKNVIELKLGLFCDECIITLHEYGSRLNCLYSFANNPDETTEEHRNTVINSVFERR